VSHWYVGTQQKRLTRKAGSRASNVTGANALASPPGESDVSFWASTIVEATARRSTQMRNVCILRLLACFSDRRSRLVTSPFK